MNDSVRTAREWPVEYTRDDRQTRADEMTEFLADLRKYVRTSGRKFTRGEMNGR